MMLYIYGAIFAAFIGLSGAVKYFHYEYSQEQKAHKLDKDLLTASSQREKESENEIKRKEGIIDSYKKATQDAEEAKGKADKAREIAEQDRARNFLKSSATIKGLEEALSHKTVNECEDMKGVLDAYIKSNSN